MRQLHQKSHVGDGALSLIRYPQASIGARRDLQRVIVDLDEQALISPRQGEIRVNDWDLEQM
jgi:hypothetical protein